MRKLPSDSTISEHQQWPAYEGPLHLKPKEHKQKSNITERRISQKIHLKDLIAE